jgi:hypothetical protein
MDRETNGGEIILYLNETFSCFLRSYLQNENIEATWVEIKKNQQKPYILGYIYRPPSSLANWNKF